MKMYIPEISDEIRLLADWTFGLYNEDRNSSLMTKMKDPREVTVPFDRKGYGAFPCTIPAGAVLKVDRIYIRKGKGDYSSITFLWKGERNPAYTEPRHIEQYGKPGDIYYQPARDVIYKYPAQPIRFWAKLEDVNNIEFEKV